MTTVALCGFSCGHVTFLCDHVTKVLYCTSHVIVTCCIMLHTAIKVHGMGSRGSGNIGGRDVAALQQQLQEMKDKVSVYMSIPPHGMICTVCI